uniref:phoenix isoform X2 n=1 Tax=Scatophagus argus TaxID=75038 RepID=UPI001ED80D50|nr:phoenix isoform X2 [Scatophagus argus]
MSQSASLAEVLSAESCHIVLETSPPDSVKKISRYLESQSKKDEASNEPAEAESDSGDSLFITQKPVPEAVRSGKRHRYKVRSHPTSSRDLEESEGDTSASSSNGETEKERRRKKYRLPTYSFPFISGGKWKPRSSLLPVPQNRSLHNFAIGGFFKCVRELWRGYQTRDEVVSSLPTVDIDGDDISPLSEEEEERPEDEDFKVVERKCFMVPSKTKRRRSWCNQLKQGKKQGKAGNARQVTSGEGQCKTFHKIAATASKSRATSLSLDTESPHGGESSCSVQAERESHDEAATSDGNLLVQKERPKTERRLPQGNKTLFQQKARAEELGSDSDATVCESLNVQRSPQQGREASTTTTEPDTAVVHTDDMPPTGQTAVDPESQILFHSLPDLISDTNTDSACSETRVSKRKKKKKDRDHKSIEEGNDQKIQPEGLHAVKSVEVEETPGLSEHNRTEPPASQARDENECNERNCLENSSHDGAIVTQEEKDVPHSKQKKKEGKKSAADSVRQEVGGHFESDVRMEDSVSCNIENGGKKKKKRRKRSDEDVEQLQLCAAAKHLNDDDIHMKKNKRKKETIVVVEEGEESEVSPGHLHESAVTEEALESSYGKRSKHKKARHSSVNGEEAADVSSSAHAVALEESTGLLLEKKKKKKKKKKTTSETPEENEKFKDEDNIQKTKQGLEEQSDELLTKKKKSEICSRTMSKDSVGQSDDSVSVRKKEKKRTSSFLVADAEEKDAQTQEEQSSLSQPVDVHVWGAEKPCVSAADFEAQSAEITGNLEESNDGVRRKKKKREMSVEQDSVEKGRKREFEEPHKAWPSVLPETTAAGVKRQKKHMGNESQLVNPTERLESAANSGYCPTGEDVVLKQTKKKKKKKEKCNEEPCRVQPPSATDHIQFQKSALNTCSVDSHKKKGKHLTSPLIASSKYECSADMSNDSSTADHAIKESLVEQASPYPEMPGNQTLNDKRVKKKKKEMKSPGNILLEGESMTKSADLEPQENKKMEKKESKSQISSQDCIMKNKHIAVKRRLHNPNEDFLTDC